MRVLRKGPEEDIFKQYGGLDSPDSALKSGACLVFSLTESSQYQDIGLTLPCQAQCGT